MPDRDIEKKITPTARGENEKDDTDHAGWKWEEITPTTRGGKKSNSRQRGMEMKEVTPTARGGG
jgi:hypothetical protein